MPDFYRRRTHPANWLYRYAVRLTARRPVPLRDTGPMISFTFDDFPCSALRYGTAILESRGGRGTFYISSLDTRPGMAACSAGLAEELHGLVAAGHELACHTATHLDCAMASDAELLADIGTNSALISAMLPGYELRNFAYPFGNASIRSRALLGRRFRSCRGIHEGINTGIIDLASLRACMLYGARANWTRFRRWIDRNADLGGWLIFITHDLSHTPTRFGTKLTLFEDLVRYASRENALLTVDAALDRAQVDHHIPVADPPG